MVKHWILWCLVFVGSAAVIFVARYLLVTHAGLDDGHVADVLTGMVAASIANMLSRAA